MKIETFAWAGPIPRGLYLDKPAMHDIVFSEYEGRLSESGGTRVPGPLRLKVVAFSYIDDNTMKEVRVRTELSPLWTYAVVHISGPAIHL